jgi:Leucine-rich repeat (LRR) protein
MNILRYYITILIAVFFSCQNACAEESPDERVARVIENIGGTVIKSKINGAVHLSMIDLEGNNLVTDEIAKEIGRLTKLDRLFLSGSSISDGMMPNIIRVDSITNLWLSHTKITNRGIQGIGTMGNLRTLFIEKTSISDAAAKELSKSRTLEHLGVSRTKVTDIFFEGITTIQSLQALRLVGVHVSDKGLSHIAKLANIKELDISIECLNARSILELRKMKKLTKLRLYGSSEHSQMFREIEKKLPDVHVFFVTATK